MHERVAMVLYKSRLVIAGLMVSIFVLLLLTLLLSAVRSNNALAENIYPETNGSVSDMSASSDAISGTFITVANNAGRTVRSAGRTVRADTQVAASITARNGMAGFRSVHLGAVTIVRGIGYGLVFAGQGIGKSVVFVFGIPGKMVGLVARAPVVNAFVRPADHAEAQVPIIDPQSPALHAAIAAMPAEPKADQPHVNVGPAWPIHGQITTYFGVSHWPYQRTHTGMDISDMKPSGVTSVKPFRPGRVIETVRSNQALGNHIILDHGSGVTSVYAHLATIAVQVSQEVTMDTILGTEGSTGVSTGTHLHFEIRVDGQAADPRQFISGQP